VTSVSRYARALRAMFAAPAYGVVEALATALRAEYGVTGCELLLVDYCLTRLQPVLRPDPAVPITGTLEGRAFIDQQVVADEAARGRRLVVPVTARGDRLGVLVLRWDRGAAEADAVPNPHAPTEPDGAPHPGGAPDPDGAPHPDGAPDLEGAPDLDGAPDTATEVELVDLAVALAHDLRAADRATDRYRLARRSKRLTLAAELQWDLLPGRAVQRPEFELAGQLEPAYSVKGDNFDWSSDADQLTVTVTDGHGDGVEAALLTALAVTAMRNARLTGGSLADQACLADQAVYAHHRGRQHVSTLLLRVDLATAKVALVDAGSPMLLLLRGGEVRRVPLEAQLPLGMFESTVYVEQQLALVPGDRLVVLSDGVHDARHGTDRYSEQGRLHRTITATRLLPPTEAVRAVLADHAVFRRSEPLTDDAAVVCLDWRGR